jgi:hypothetical protein
MRLLLFILGIGVGIVCIGNRAVSSHQYEGEVMDRLQSCIETLRVLAQSNDPNRVVLIERNIDEYLKTGNDTMKHSLRRVRDLITRADRTGVVTRRITPMAMATGATAIAAGK